jgi:hypothetical protein
VCFHFNWKFFWILILKNPCWWYHQNHGTWLPCFLAFRTCPKVTISDNRSPRAKVLPSYHFRSVQRYQVLWLSWLDFNSFVPQNKSRVLYHDNHRTWYLWTERKWYDGTKRVWWCPWKQMVDLISLKMDFLLL